MRDHLIDVVALVAIAIIIGAECAARADEWTPQEVALARLCVVNCGTTRNVFMRRGGR